MFSYLGPSRKGPAWTPRSAAIDATTAIPAGELKFRLDGQKLKGRFTIVRTNDDVKASAVPAPMPQHIEERVVEKGDLFAAAQTDAQELPKV